MLAQGDAFVVGGKACLCPAVAVVSETRVYTAGGRRKSPLPADDDRVPRAKTQDVPMLECLHCGIRQYAAKSHVEQPKRLACDGPLGRPKSASPVTGHSRFRSRGGKKTIDLGRFAAPGERSG